MEADDLLCSRNARPPKALVGRAQWETKQAALQERSPASLEGAFDRGRPMRAFEDRPGRPPRRETSKLGRSIIGRPSPGLLARFGVPVGGRVRKLHTVGVQLCRSSGTTAELLANHPEHPFSPF